MLTLWSIIPRLAMQSESRAVRRRDGPKWIFAAVVSGASGGHVGRANGILLDDSF